MVTDLQHSLDEFDQALRHLVDAYPLDEDFWPEFAAIATSASEHLLPKDRPTFHNEIVAMLRQHGKLPSMMGPPFQRNAA